MKPFFASLILVVFCSSNAFSQWTYVGKSSDGSSYFIKKHSQVSGSTKFWVKEVSNLLSYINDAGKKVIVNGSSIKLYDSNCDGMQMSLRSLTVYDLKGNVLSSFKVEEYNATWKDVVPDSIGEAYLTKACEIL